MNAEKQKTDFKVPNLERGLQVLEYLVDHQERMTLSDIARALDIPKNSTSRILAALQHYGYLEKDEGTREFYLSRKLFSMAYKSANEKSLLENSLDVMRQLRDEVRETVVITVMDKDEGLILEQMPGLHLFRFVCEPGLRQPGHATSSTKVIIAHLPVDERKAFINGLTFTKFTEATLTSAQALLDECDWICERGYAFDRGEVIDGVRCASAPIFDFTGKPIASLTVTGPANRLPDAELPSLGETIKRHTAEISRRLGYNV